MIRKFISYYKPHLGLFTLDMLCAVTVALCNLYYPTLARKIINEYSLEEDLTPIIVGAVLLLIVYLIKAAGTYIMGYYGHVVGVRMQKDMRRDLFDKYQRLPFSYFDDHKTGDLLSRLTGDLQNVSELAHHGPENLFLAILMFVGAFVILLNINVTLTLIMFAIIPFIILFTVLTRRSMFDAMKNSRKEMSNVNSTLENSITGIRETKAYVAHHHEKCKFDATNTLFAKYRSQSVKWIGIYSSVMELLTDVLYLVIIFIGGVFMIKGKLNAADFTAFLLYINMFINPIHRFVTLFEQLQEGMSGFSRFYEIMVTPDEEDNGKIEIEDIHGDVEFENVTFSYSPDDGNTDKSVITNLSLKLKAGDTVALVGPSGGGKSTICNLIPRFYNAQSGKIRIDGIDVMDITLDSLRRNIGMVSQNVFLFDGTVRDNIAYARPDASDEEIVEAARRANIHDFILTLDNGYDTEVGERGVKLSGGQRQRISIARVFLKNPKLLILDEATSALDNVTEMQIQSSLEELSRGRTVIVVAHRLSTVKNADEIVVIDSTGIVERGSHEELIELDGEYNKLYSYQFKSLE